MIAAWKLFRKHRERVPTPYFAPRWGNPKPLITERKTAMDRKRARTHEVHLRLDDKEYAALEKNRKKFLTARPYVRACPVPPAKRETEPQRSVLLPLSFFLSVNRYSAF